MITMDADDFKPRAFELSELICKDCIFRTSKIATCNRYPAGKPAKVFRDSECEAYIKDQAYSYKVEHGLIEK